MIWEKDNAHHGTHINFAFQLTNPQFARDLRTIAGSFELCHQGSIVKCVSGGICTEIDCVSGADGPGKSAYYIAQDISNRRANLMEDLCRDMQLMMVASHADKPAVATKAQTALTARTAKLAQLIRNDDQALSMVDAAYAKTASVDWKVVNNLVRFRPDQGPLERRSQLVKEAHAALSAAFSKPGIERLFGAQTDQPDACIICLGEVRNCQGSYEYSGDCEPGFDDSNSSLGLINPPLQPALPIGMLDVGLERLLLRFLLCGTAEAATGYERFSLTLSGNAWRLIERQSFVRIPPPADSEARLAFLTKESGVLTYLLGGVSATRVALLDIQAVAIKDGLWQMARLDYRLAGHDWVLPIARVDDHWATNQRWDHLAYRHKGGCIQNQDFFRSVDELREHNAQY